MDQHEHGVTAQSPDGGALLTTGEMARRSSNTLRTVRFYEEEARSCAPSGAPRGGHRLFDQPELERLMLVTDMRSAGLSLDEIKEILEVKRGAACGSDAAKRATGILVQRIDELRESSRCSPACARTSPTPPT